jgi:hypothetical protein
MCEGKVKVSFPRTQELLPACTLSSANRLTGFNDAEADLPPSHVTVNLTTDGISPHINTHQKTRFLSYPTSLQIASYYLTIQN